MAFTDPVFQWLAYELAAIFAIIAIWLIYRMSRKSRKIALETRSAVNAIKQSRDERRQQLSDTLHANYGFDENTLAAELDALTARERELHKYAMSVFVGQDAKALANLNMSIQQHLDAGLAITPINSSVPDGSVQQVQQLAAENAELTATISRLNQQLEQVTQVAEKIEIDVTELDTTDDVFSDNNQQTTALVDDETLFEEDVESLLVGHEIEIIDVIGAENPDVDVVADDMVDVPQVFNETEEQLLEDALFKDVEFESGDVDEQTPEQESVKSIDDSATVTSKSRMAEFANADWQATVPDIYGKSKVILAETVDAVDENIEKIEVVKTRSSLNDFLKPDWQPNTPDVYGKHASITEPNTELQAQDNVLERLEDITPALDAEDTLPSDNEASVAELPEVLSSDAADLSHPFSSFEDTNEAEALIKDSEATSVTEQPISDASDDSEKANENVSAVSESEHQTASAADLEKQIDPLQATLEAIGDQHIDAVDFDTEVEYGPVNTALSEQEIETIALQQAEEAIASEHDADAEFETEVDRLAALMTEPETLIEGAAVGPSADQLLHEEEIASSEQQIESLLSQENDKVDIDSTTDALEKLRARLRQKTAALAGARPPTLDKAIDTERDQTEQIALSDNAVEQSDVTEEKKPDETLLAEEADSVVADAAHSDLAVDALLSVDDTNESLPVAQNSLLDTEQVTSSADNLDLSQPVTALAEQDEVAKDNESRYSDERTAVTVLDEANDFDEALSPVIDDTPLSSKPEISEEGDRATETTAEVKIAAAANSQEEDLTLEQIESAAMSSLENETVNTEVVTDKISSNKLPVSEVVSTDVSSESVEKIEDFVAALAREQALAAQERARTESEISGFEKQSPQPALPEEQDISGFLSELDQLRESQKLANQTGNQAHLNAAAEYPLPEQTELDQLMDEVRTLQPHSKLKPVSDKEQQTALRSILSKIPSFAESKTRQS